MFRISAVGLDLVARLARDERGRHDDAGDAKLFEPTGDDEAAGARFVANFDHPLFGAAQLVDESFERMQIVGEGAEVTHSAAAPALGDDGSDGILVDIESEEEFSLSHGVFAGSGFTC